MTPEEALARADWAELRQRIPSLPWWGALRPLTREDRLRAARRKSECLARLGFAVTAVER